jgi:putative ABC transport system permease protein
MLIVAIGAISSRYASVVRELNVFYRGKVVVVARGSLFIQAIPIGSSLLEDTVNEVKRVDGVKAAVPMLVVIGSSTGEGIAGFVPINVSIGIPTGNWSILVENTPLKPGGRWPSASSSEGEVVVGGYLAAINNLTVNSEIMVKGHDMRVVGILDTPSVFLDRVIIMPLDVAQNVYGYDMRINMMVVEPWEGVTEEELGHRIEAEVQSVKALTSKERNEIVEPVLNDLEMWNIGISVVLFSISMVLVMTVAAMNISERRRELATLDAIGAQKSIIIRIVVTETALIGLFGGVAGILLGSLAALLLSSFYANVPLQILFPGLFVIVTPTLMLEILIFTVTSSCIAGIIPAITTARKSIVEVLRSEY